MPAPADARRRAKLLARDDLALLRSHLERLAEEPVAPCGAEGADARSRPSAGRKTLRKLLLAWRSSEVWCRNGIIADFSLVLSGCTKGNAVPYTLGAGAGAKATSMY